jgi:hypothetical protein
MMSQKIKRLAMNDENPEKFYIIKNKPVSTPAIDQGWRKKKRGKLRPIPANLLKTHVEKMSDFSLSMMLMKTNELRVALHDVYETKGLIKIG